MKAYVSEIIVAVLIVVFLGLLTAPFGFMPSMGLMVVLAGLAVAVAVFGIFLLRERANDEREGLHRLIADRFAFLAGGGVLTLGVILQSLRHDLDPWLSGALASTVLVKVIGLIYSRSKH